MRISVMKAAGVVLSSLSFLGGITRQADTVFQTWIEENSPYVHNQFCDVCPATMADHLNNDYVMRINQKIAQVPATVAPFASFLSMPHNVPQTHIDSFTFTLNDQMRAALQQVYRCLAEPEKISSFLRFLRSKGLATDAINVQEEGEDFNKVIEKYMTFMEILFSHQNELIQQERLLAVANRFFEFCFNPSTWNEFKSVIAQKSNYPLGRLLYTTMWYNLASIGWKEWHRSCLEKLKREAEQGKEVVYIAGGCDIYAMIKEGIYNIRIVDPMLPTQPRYYIPEWFWFVRGTNKRRGMGDLLVFKFPDRTITMKRTYYREQPEFFEALLSDGRTEKIQKSITRWELRDHKKRRLGTITFDRRFCNQDDFTPASGKVVLLSFNELYYVTTCDEHEGWGINPNMLADDCAIYVKQLRNPVSKSMMCCMREADASSFQFIKLGTCIN